MKKNNNKNKNVVGTSNPYCTIKLGDIKYRTRTVPSSINPEWNEKFTFDIAKPEGSLKFKIW